MVAGVSYQRALDALPPSHGGYYNRDLVLAAGRLGITLELSGRDRTGVLLARIRWGGKRGQDNPGGHFVAISRGRVFDPSGGPVTPLEEYLVKHNAKLGHTYRRVS
jgi:hypothetical protein